jgi:hypothetical protein
MPNVAITDFDVTRSGAVRNRGSHLIHLTWADLVWAAVTVGRRNRFDTLRFGRRSEMEIIYRGLLILANLTGKRLRGSVFLGASDAFEALDGSEKGAISYFVGLAMSKLMAEQYCGINWLMHLDVYSRPAPPHGVVIPVRLAAGKSRPDLIGRNRVGQWAVLESKGRTHTVTDDLRADAKDQTRRVLTVNGRRPRWRLAVLTRLAAGRARGSVSIDVVDPVGPTDDAERVSIPPGVLIADYYRTIMGAVLTGEDRFVTGAPDSAQFLMRRFEDFDGAVGIRKDVLSVLMDFIPQPFDDPDSMPRDGLDVAIGRVLMSADPFRENEHFRMGGDGIAVELGQQWRGRQMRRPQRRRDRDGQ